MSSQYDSNNYFEGIYNNQRKFPNINNYASNFQLNYPIQEPTIFNHYHTNNKVFNRAVSLSESLSTQCSDDWTSEKNLEEIKQLHSFDKVLNYNNASACYQGSVCYQGSKSENKSIRDFMLTPTDMLIGFMKGRLCLSCDSIKHPMPKCPSKAFVCPNCHKQGHRGENCDEKCRFCQKFHKGTCILECIQYTAKQIRSSDIKLSFLEGDNEFNYTSSLINYGQSKQERRRENIEFIEEDLSFRPDNAWGRTIYAKGIPITLTELEITSQINKYLTTGYVVRVQKFHTKDHCFITLSSKATAAEIISKRVYIEGKLLNLQWRKSGGYQINDEPNKNISSNVFKPDNFLNYFEKDPLCTSQIDRKFNSNIKFNPITDSSNSLPQFDHSWISQSSEILLDAIKSNLISVDDAINIILKIMYNECT